MSNSFLIKTSRLTSRKIRGYKYTSSNKSGKQGKKDDSMCDYKGKTFNRSDYLSTLVG